MSNIFLDTETCGLHGMCVLIQYAVDDGPITLFEPWKRPVRETLDLIEYFCQHTVIGFNLTFDWFHLQKLYAVFSRVAADGNDWIVPDKWIELVAMCESQAFDQPTIKPAGALDLMLHARKGPYQSLMQRDDIVIRRVPAGVAYTLHAELERDLTLPAIYYAKAKKLGSPWQLVPCKRKPGWFNLVHRFKPSGSLKNLAQHALGIQEPATFKDIELDKQYRPVEYGYAPTASAVSGPDVHWAAQQRTVGGAIERRGYAWPGVIAKHIEHWHANEPAREYARNDIVYTRGLYEHFERPEANDDDSVLACMVGALRWRGFAVDTTALREQLTKAQQIIDASPVNVNRPSEVRAYLAAVMTPLEAEFIADTTAKEVLAAIADGTDALFKPFTQPEECELCNCTGTIESQSGGIAGSSKPKCPRCGGTGQLAVGKHPASSRAAQLLQVKRAKKEVELYQKLLLAGRLHADFVVIGAKSSRMSGAGGMNAQAIKRTNDVRRCFPLAWPGYQLSAGDFAGFEVTIADAVYADPALRSALRRGEKIHALFGAAVYNKSVKEIKASEGTAADMYTPAKSGVFLDMYGGEAPRLAKTLGISVEAARLAQARWQAMFPLIGKARERIKKQFGCLSQAEKGGVVTWHDPDPCAKTLLGFPRFFTMENRMIRTLYDMGQRWVDKARSGEGTAEAGRPKATFLRSRDGKLQTAEGAAASALFGAAFGLSASNVRAAGNHEIQGTGAGITKTLQRRIWDLQPVGVHRLRVAPMNVHDEICCPCLPEYVDRVADVVRDMVEEFRQVVPLLGIEWFKKWQTWASKKDGTAEGELKFLPAREAA